MRVGICEWLAYFLRMTRPGQTAPTKKKKNYKQANSVDPKESTQHHHVVETTPSGNGRMINNSTNQQYTAVTVNVTSNNQSEESPQSSYPGKKELQGILKELHFLTDKVKTEDDFNEKCSDWKFAAMVIDRLCMIVFTIFTVSSTCAILFSAPTIIT